MKIAYLGNFTQPHCTEVHLAATLEDLGYTVTRLQEQDGPSNGTIPEQVQGHDLFLWTRTWRGYLTNADLLRINQYGIKTASYHLDLYVGLQRADGLDFDPFWRTNYVFTPDGDPASAEVFKSKNINHYYMKPGVFKQECYLATRTQPFTHQNDVIFVGGGATYGHPEWPYRAQLVNWLAETYGSRYKKFGYPEITVRNAELNQLYADTKVVIGDSLCLGFTHPYYWSDRVYETLGRGGFIIHPYIKGMEEEFVSGKNIVYYKYNDWEQLRKEIDFYLAHDDERERIRDAGQAYVREHCTYNNRLTQMLEIVNV